MIDECFPPPTSSFPVASATTGGPTAGGFGSGGSSTWREEEEVRERERGAFGFFLGGVCAITCAGCARACV